MPSNQDNEINQLSDAILQMRRVTFSEDESNEGNSPQIHSIKWYFPDTIRVYDELNKMHIRVLNVLNTNNASTIANCLISKIYYSVLIHIAIIRIRMITGDATQIESDTYEAIDDVVKCSQLPLSKSVGIRLTRALPYCNDTHQQFKITPARSHFIDARVDNDEDECSYLVGLSISENNTCLSDPIIPIRVMRWLRQKVRHTNNSQTSKSSKLFYLTTGMIFHSSRIADQLFKTDINPLEAILADPALTPNSSHDVECLMQSIGSLSLSQIPKDTILVRPGEDEDDIGLLRLKNIATSNWFNHAKAIASTEAILCDELTQLKKVIKPIESSNSEQFNLHYSPINLESTQLNSWNRESIWT